MLSVVTLMAVAFLAVSRRERATVTTSSDRLDAKALAEMALQRAEAEVVSRSEEFAGLNSLNFDLLVSRNFINPAGFRVGNANVEMDNVSYTYPDGAPLSGDDLLAMYRNLRIDARVPVFIETNQVTHEWEHRFFLDFNRNGWFETNGMQIEVDRLGRSLLITNFHIGDPEWIGVLKRPDQSHSGSNHFYGRFAFLVVPSGKTLDINFIHNQAKRLQSGVDGFMRNQGVGSWEINLAAFLAQLNTNAWPFYFYQTNQFTPSTGIAFENALTLSRYRLRQNNYDSNPTYNRLQSVRQLFRAVGFNAFLRDGNDGYSDGPIQLGVDRPFRMSGTEYEIDENDEPNEPWSGADMPFQYFDPQELFHVSEPNILQGTAPIDRFTNRLVQVSTGRSTYDRHTFYRLLSQLGTDSVAANHGRIHLNYDNRLEFDSRLEGARPDPRWGSFTTNFVEWDPSGFFTNAADAILKLYYPPIAPGNPLISITNLAIWPTNLYVPTVHRSLQVAANIFDATTNIARTPFPFLPHVYRPIFQRRGGGVFIAGYEPVLNGRLFWENSVQALNQHLDLDEDGANTAVNRNTHVAGIPLVIGAKKGFPNFNEFALQTVVQMSRKIELVKSSPQARPSITNQLYTLGISNLIGIEFWNSYTQAFPRRIELRVRVETDMVLSNQFRVIRKMGPMVFLSTNIYEPTDANSIWRGGEFKLPMTRMVNFLPDAIYRRDGSLLNVSNRNSLPFEAASGYPIPYLSLTITNRLQAMLIDASATLGNGRIIDYVDLDNLNSFIDITTNIFKPDPSEFSAQSVNGSFGESLMDSFWYTNRLGNAASGVRNQIQAALGEINVAEWNSASFEPVNGQDKEKAVERFRQFVGMGGGQGNSSPTLRMQVPFSPARKLFKNSAWQVNDPLVNDHIGDLIDPSRTNDIRYVKPVRAMIGADTHNLGKINYRYRPWQVNLYSSADSRDFDLSVKDPQIRSSDDWDFPTNAFPSIGWLGRVHRGTPWQTVYLKSAMAAIPDWIEWSGDVPRALPGFPEGFVHPSMHPTNDWWLPNLFTTAIGKNAARGLLSVNQTGEAAWAAVLCGIPVIRNFGPDSNESILIEPNTVQFRILLEGINRARSLRKGRLFSHMGDILATPELSVGDNLGRFSPYLRVFPGRTGSPTDAVVERIPQMIMSLLGRVSDERRFVVYAYGQSLRPAPASVVTEFGPYFQMPTNYVITGEYVTKTLMRLETVGDVDPLTGAPRIRVLPVKESYNEVPPIE